MLRIKGEVLLFQGAQGAAAAHHFRQVLDWARRQGTLSWELRAPTSLAQLLRDQNRLADAIAVLQPIYDRFTDGFDTADLKQQRFFSTRSHSGVVLSAFGALQPMADDAAYGRRCPIADSQIGGRGEGDREARPHKTGSVTP
ncbi:MAG TPA: hypothetical protein VE687_06785 [Stellaceae bacterium]|nr:hypothetical protein [Stellaceae bacterium]